MAGARSGKELFGHKAVWVRRLSLLMMSLIMLSTLSACAWFDSLVSSEEEAPIPKPSPAKHWEQAMAYRRAGNMTMAATSMENAIKADPNMYQAYYQLGRIYSDMGRKEQARRVWQVGLARAQGGPDRRDYPKQRAMAALQAALATTEPAPQPKTMPEPKPMPEPQPEPAIVQPAAPAAGDYAVLYSSNLNKSYAMRDVSALEGMGLSAEVRSAEVRGRTFHRVLVGCCTTKSEAVFIQNKLRSKGVNRKTTVLKVK